MKATHPNPAVRFLPSLTDLAFLMPVILLLAGMGGAVALLGDGDTGWHIRTGEWILDNGRVPDRDLFSFTRPGEPWFAWEWLWDLVFAWLHRRGGMAAVVLVSLILISVTFALLYRLARRKCSNVLVAILMTVLAIAGSTIHWLARPHLVTILFAVIFYSVLERVRDGRFRLLLYLPPLTILWTNLHGGFLVGLAIIGAYAGGELVAALVEAEPLVRRQALGRAKRYLAAMAGCLAASLLNPYFYQLHVHIYRYLTEPYHFKNIVEFRPLDFQHPMAMFVEAMMVLGMAAAAWNLARKRFCYALLLGGWLHLALVSARNVPIFALLAAPVAAAAIEEWLKLARTAPVAEWVRDAAARFENYAAGLGSIDRIGRIPVVPVLVVLALGAVLFAPAPPKRFQTQYDPQRYPSKAIEVLRGQEMARNIFTDDEWGDYVIYRLYPHTKVFIDGRSDFYGPKFGERYLEIMNVKYDWEKQLGRYGVATILLPVSSSLAGVLKESRRWRPVYDDGIAIIFRAASASRQQVPAAPESRQASAAGDSGGVSRDRAITKQNNHDPRIKIANTRSNLPC